jgi:hypothetical protein
MEHQLEELLALFFLLLALFCIRGCQMDYLGGY